MSKIRERNVQKAKLNDLYPIIQEALELGKIIKFTPSGISMRPLLEHRRDTVLLNPITEQLKKYDIVLFRREDGTFVLHRIVKVCQDVYWIRGDNQYTTEKNIQKEQIIGVVGEIYRNKKKIKKEGVIYKSYTVLWNYLYWIRKIIVKVYTKTKKWNKNL